MTKSHGATTLRYLPEQASAPPHGTPPEPGDRPAPDRGGARGAVIAAAVTCILGGAVVLVGWHVRATAIVQVSERYNPMAYTTAVSFVLVGTGLLAAARGHGRVVAAAAGALGFLAGLTALEYLTGAGLGIDGLGVEPYVWHNGPPGRMAMNTTISFVACAGALAVLAAGSRARRANVAAAAATVVLATAAVAFFGYAGGGSAAYGWGQATSMAPHTAVLFVALGCGLFALALDASGWTWRAIPAWAAAPAAVVALAVGAGLWAALLSGAELAPPEAVPVARAVTGSTVVMAALVAVAVYTTHRAQGGRRRAERLAHDLGAEVRSRLAAEEEARRGEQRLFKVLDALPVGVFVAAPDGRPYYANQEAARLLGQGVIPHARVDDLAILYQVYVAGTGALYPRDRMPLVQALAGRTAHVDDMQVRRPDGTVPIEVWAAPITTREGRVEYGLAVFADITERRLAEAELAEQAALLDLAHDAIIALDDDGRVVQWNRGATRTYGWSAAEAVGRRIQELLGTALPVPLEDVRRELREHGEWTAELSHRTKDGRRLVVDSRWAPYRGRTGAGILEVDRDITARRAAERALRERARDLERANAELETFAYAASHDLAEPLRAISGPVSLLARRYRGQLDAEADKYIEFAVDGCARMQTLIDDLLRYSRVGRLEKPHSAVDAGAVVRAAMANLQAMLTETQAQVTVGALPEVVGEPTQLVQLFQNLLSNAVKFHRPGVAPAVRVDAVREGAFWRFTVTDNGIGIEPHHRDRVFGMFKRLHTRDAYPGTGIGLALCRKIVEHHGGEIGVEDTPDGQGSRFWFTLPVEPPTQTGDER